MNIRLISLVMLFGFVGCSSTPTELPNTTTSTPTTVTNVATTPVQQAPTVAKPQALATLPAEQPIAITPAIKANKIEIMRYRCADLNEIQAQKLLKAGHTYLDADGDGDACEPDPRTTQAAPATRATPAVQATQATRATGTCGSKKYCSQMSSCAEAQFYLNECGLSKLDKDGDGTPCEALCK